MVSKNLIWASAFFALATAQQQNNQKQNGQNGQNGQNSASAATATQASGAQVVVDPSVIQTGSFFDGSNGLGAESGQALSATSQNNFVDFCKGQTLTNGLQQLQGSCNSIPMGNIPAKAAMVSSIIINPKSGSTIPAGQDFTIQVQTANLVAGAFTNADTTYYAAPQALQGGKVVGHTHVTVQDLGNSLNPTTPLDATQFAFFKGINDAGNGQGLLSADVAGGLPEGNYRLCTLTSASNHQPVLMPVAQRGSQDDCTKFTVSGSGGATNAAANNGAGGQKAAATAAQAVTDGPGAIVSGNNATADAASGQNNGNAGQGQANAANGQNNAAKQGQQQQGKKNQRRAPSFATRIFVA